MTVCRAREGKRREEKRREPDLSRRVVLIAGVPLLLFSACREGAFNESGPPIRSLSQASTATDQARVKLTAQRRGDEELINAATVTLPHTGATYHQGKFLSRATKKASVRAYDVATSVEKDWRALEDAERQAVRAKYGAWSPGDKDRLKATLPSKIVRASFWLQFNVPSWSVAGAKLAGHMAQAKAPMRSALKSAGKVVEVWDDPEAPILTVEGDAASVDALGHHPSVGLASLEEGKYQAINLSEGVDGQEQLDMGLPELGHYFGSVYEGTIVQWDGCPPSTLVTTPSLPSRLYIPLGTTWTTPWPSAAECADGGPTLADRQSHAEHTLGIIAARKGWAMNGIEGFLPQLGTVSLATLGDIDQHSPTAQQEAMARIKQVAVSQPQPLVQSWSSFLAVGNSHPSCYSTPFIYQIYTDFKSLSYPSLNVYSAGNEAWTEGTGVGACQGGAVYVLPKQRNGIVVGGYHDGNTVPAVNRMYFDTPLGANGLDAYSAWRAPSSPHNDIRVPHLSAVGTYVQSVDHNWRWDYGSNPPADWPHIMVEKQTDERPSWKGTSFATPQAAALGMHAMKQTTCVWPNDRQLAVQVARALLIASSNRPVTVHPESGEFCDGSPCPDGVYHLRTGQALRDQRRWGAGAGALNAEALASIMGFYCYSGGNSFGGGGVPMPAPPEPLPDGPTGTFPVPGDLGEYRRCRFALAWNPYPSCSEYNCTEAVGYDLDVCLWVHETGEFLGCAASWENNYEFIDVSCPAGRTIEWRGMFWSGHPETTVTYGWAQMVGDN